jgi:Leucine-rich repeat (LRR) protein
MFLKILFLLFCGILISSAQQRNLNCAMEEVDYFGTKRIACVFRQQTLYNNETAIISTSAGTDTAQVFYALFQSSNIYYVPSQIFTTFPNMDTVNIGGSNLHQIKANTFQDAYSLKIFWAQYHSLSTLQADAFLGAKNLELINLNGGELTQISGYAFRGLPKLYQILLSSNKLTKLDPSTFSTLSSLKDIFLADNQLVEVPENLFQYNTKLGVVHLKKNKLTFIPNNLFKNNLLLNQIYLGDNQIRFLSNTMFSHLTNLQYFFFEKNICADFQIIAIYSTAGQIKLLPEKLANCSTACPTDLTEISKIKILLLQLKQILDNSTILKI